MLKAGHEHDSHCQPALVLVRPPDRPVRAGRPVVLSALATSHLNDMLVTPESAAYLGDFGFDLDTYIKAHGIDGLLGALLADPSPF